MKKLDMKDLLVIVLSAFINMFVWHDRNPAGVAFFCAAYALIPGKILLSVASLTGMAYALPMTAFIRYTGLITTVMMMAAVLRKVRPGLLTPVVMCGLMTLTMLTAGIGYSLAYGEGWQQHMMSELPKSALELAAALGIYWLSVGGIAFLKGRHPVGRKERMSMKEEAMITKNQLHAFSESFRKLSQSFEVDTSPRGTLSDQEMQDIFNAVTEQVCKDCSRCSYCWENVFEDSCESAYEILKLCGERVDMKKKDLPERFRQRCVRSDNFLAEARRMMGLAQTNLSWQNRLAESRLALAGQFGEVADVIGDFSKQISDEPVRQGAPEKQVVHRMTGQRINVRRIAASNRQNGRKCVYIEAKTPKNIQKTAQEAADIIGRVYGRRYLPRAGTPPVIGQRWEMLSFEEDVRYRTIVGDARMVRMGETVSGDSFTVMHMESGQTVLSLSDGMGSGEKAEKESNRIISLLEQLLTTGFNRQSAIRLIHSVVLSGSEPHTYSTLDLATLDLFTGRCELVKMGAAASFIKNGEEVKKLTSDALPPGVLPEPESEVLTADMKNGDMLIMMSDGTLGSLGKGDDQNEEKMAEFLKNCTAVNPQELANAVLNHAMACSHYEAEDDMTVLVCGLYRKPENYSGA